VRAGHEDAVRELLAEYAEDVRAADGTVLFEPSTATEHPQDFVVFERYRDKAAFQAHIGAVENRTFNAHLAEHIESEVSLQFLDPLGERA
jgi:quinol monooxygenase YgiN